MTNTYPQVALFGSMGGGWREQHVIPVLERLGVTYFNPAVPSGWTPEDGDQEAAIMAHCETIVMVINKTRPSFTGLAETGWAALGAAQRGQHYILQVDLDYHIRLPDSLRRQPEGAKVEELFNHWIRSSRYLVHHHAENFQLPTLHLEKDIAGVVVALEKIYKK
jgi:hypothetical protein